MGTKFPDIFAALAAPFESHQLKVRSQQGRQLHYITARTAMNRIDSVLGPENWGDDYFPFGDSGVKCVITITLPDGTTVTKSGVGGTTEMHDASDTDKTGESDALKRAAVKLGVARYLYRDGLPTYVQEQSYATDANIVSVPRDDPRRAPERPRAQPSQATPDATQSQHVPDQRPSGNGHGSGPPRSGRGMFAWTKEMEQKYEVSLLKYLNDWAKLQDFPPRMVDWDESQVALAHKEAVRKLNTVGERSGNDSPDGDGGTPSGGPTHDFPQNASGHGRGQYASPAQVAAYRDWAVSECAARNAEWADLNSTPSGELPDGFADILHPHQLTWHLLKWGIRVGRLADVGLTVDSETGKLVEKCSIEQAKQYVAIVFARDRAAVEAEALALFEREVETETRKRADAGAANVAAADAVPATGTEILAWAQAVDQQHGVHLLNYLIGVGRRHRFPDRLVDWGAEQVATAHAEANRKLSEMRREAASPERLPGRGDAWEG